MSFKQQRQQFIATQFPFPTGLEAAIKGTMPLSFRICSMIDPLPKLRLNDADCLCRLLQKYCYCRHFYWAYSIGQGFELSDWCSLFWVEDKGLFVHFEWLALTDVSDPDNNNEMDAQAWEFFYAKRKEVLAGFCGGRFIKYSRQEEFCLQLMTVIGVR